MAAHGIPYVATASVGFPDDFIVKAKRARDMEGGFRYIHVHSPCPTGWRFPEKKAIEMARLAVDCGMWLLYEVIQGDLTLTYRPTRRKPVEEYLSKQGRFSHLSKKEIEEIQAKVDRECAKHNF